MHQILIASAAALALADLAHAQTASNAPADEPVVVTASRLNLMGAAVTASEGAVPRQEIDLRPIFRIGQLFETVPGLVVTVHSGESKANQYELRGFDVDHGTDFATFVDGMPVNQGTNMHGQGYSDQTFLAPQIVAGLDYAKGPYFAATGDFGAVGSARVRLLDVLPGQISVSAGTLGDEEVFAGATRVLSPHSRVWAALAYDHLDGPWIPPSGYHRLNAAVRFSGGDDASSFSLTGLYDRSAGRGETDQPLRAIQEGLIGRFGVLDPTDGGRTERFSLSARYHEMRNGWSLAAGGYVIRSRESLTSDFTHFLDDPVRGDQEQQDETRTVIGGDAALTVPFSTGGVQGQTTLGVQARHDGVYVDRRHTAGTVVLDYCMVEGALPSDTPPAPADAPPSETATAVPAVSGACTADQVRLTDLGFYVENATRWTPWLRTIIGLRQEVFAARDRSLITGARTSATQSLLQPKASLVIGPWRQVEVYVSAGRGFHSDDVRGVFGTVPIEGLPVLAGKTPLLAPATGEEIGLRGAPAPGLTVQIALFQEDFSSELRFDEDHGQDQATAPSRRRGVEASAQYRPFTWMEINTDLALARARYRGSPAQLADFGLAGAYITQAPGFIGSVGLLIDHLGRWSGALQWRHLGAYPITDGASTPRDKGYGEVNLEAGCNLTRALKIEVSVFNLFNSRANAAAFFYASRLPGEPAEGVAGAQVHPLEPISARVGVIARF